MKNVSEEMKNNNKNNEGAMGYQEKIREGHHYSQLHAAATVGYDASSYHTEVGRNCLHLQFTVFTH